MIISDTNTDDVYAFSSSGTLLATITGFNSPFGLAGDAAGNVYVANGGASNVLVYKNDYKTLVTTLYVPNLTPTDVAVASSGAVAVTSLGENSHGKLYGAVSFYAAGATEPTLTVTDPKWAGVNYGVFDNSGNLYIDGQTSYGFPNKVLLGVILRGATAITTLTTTNKLTYAAGMQMTSAGSLVIAAVGGAKSLVPAVYTYAPALSGTLGSPTATTKLLSSKYSIYPKGLSLTANATDLWVVDTYNHLGMLYKYPAGGVSKESVGIGELISPWGILNV